MSLFSGNVYCLWASLVAQLVKNPPAMQETRVRSLGWEDPLEKRTATHSSIMAWGIPWTICIQSMGLQRVGHDWANFTFTLLFIFQIIPFYVLNATNYFGRIVDKHEDLCATLNAEMKEYFEDSSNKATVEKVEKFGLYGLAEKSVFHR